MNYLNSTVTADATIGQSAIDNGANVTNAGRNPIVLNPAVLSRMASLEALLQTDLPAAMAVANELAQGSPFMQAVFFEYGLAPLGPITVGLAAFGATRALDNFFNGAITDAVADAAYVLLHTDNDPSAVNALFGGEGFTVDNVDMMSAICSNWTDYWRDEPQIIAPIQAHLV